MSNYTPTTKQVRRACAATFSPSEFDRWLSATLATVRPNPDSPTQVEAVALAIAEVTASTYCGGSCASCRNTARAVLAAQAEALA